MSTPHHTDILKYWAAAIRHEESLTSRPKAIRAPGPDTFNWLRPMGNHAYFKLPRTASFEQLLLNEKRAEKFEVAGEQRSFLGRIVRQVYFRQDHGWPTERSVSTTVVVGFPSLYFPRSDELATLVRVEMGIEWLDEAQQPILVPSRREREQKKFPNPPTRFSLTKVTEDDDGVLPLSVDGRLLTQTLGFPEEIVLDFMNSISALEQPSVNLILAALIELLESGHWSPEREISALPQTSTPFECLFDATQRRLQQEGGQTFVYDVGLVFDGAQSFTTHHLRRDLSLLASGKLRRALVNDGPLRAYLSGHSAAPQLAPLMGQSAPTSLSASQRLVAEQFLGSEFTAAQGPPGTGKTRLISDVSAHMLIERMYYLAQDGLGGAPFLLITSTNNRAVDQVLEHLHSDLPWGLRTGSQQITETVTVATIDHVLAWMENHQDDEINWPEEKSRFLEVYEASKTESEPHQAHREYQNTQFKLEHEAHQLHRSSAPALFDDEQKLMALDVEALNQLLERITLIQQRFGAIIRLLSPRTPKAFERGALGWKKLKTDAWHALSSELESYGIILEGEVIEKPSKIQAAAEICEVWIESIEETRDELKEAYALINQVRRFKRRGDLEADLLARQETHRRHVVPPLDATSMNGAQFILFEAAKRFRKAWFCHNRQSLQELLLRVRAMALEFRSLKRVFQNRGRDLLTFQNMFPVLGSTLLSIANVMGTELDVVTHAVIDEGGQCHSAYAVSALLRVHHALIIGDVNQLEPVYTLSREDDKRVQKAARVEFDSTESRAFEIYENCGNSAQTLANRVLNPPPQLTDHYRSHAALIGLCDELCDYGLSVHTNAEQLTNQCGALVAPLLASLVEGQQIRTRGSWSNEAEVVVTVQWIRSLLESGIKPQQIAVLTPYVGQLDLLRTALSRMGLSTVEPLGGVELSEEHHLSIGTVHRFQGGERDIILYSSVVTQSRSLQFQNSRVNLLNVAISRAKKHFITIGNLPVLAQGKFSSLLVSRSQLVAPKEGGT